MPGGATTNWPNELKAPPLSTGSDSKHRVSCSLMAHGCNSGPPSFSNVPGGSSRACHGCPAQKLFRVNPNAAAAAAAGEEEFHLNLIFVLN